MTLALRTLAATLLLGLLAWTGPASSGTPAPIKIGVSESLPYYAPRVMEAWQAYLSEQLNRPVEFVHRPSHNDIFHLLVQDRLDFAWVCPAHYQQHRQEVELLATPLFQDTPRYQVLLLAPADPAAGIDSLQDLKGKVAAFAEPDTNFGNGLIKRALHALGFDPDHFFRRSFFTGDHDRVVYAVANGLAHGGAVINQTWEVLSQTDPTIPQRVRVIWRSGWRPLPPIVSAPHVDPALRRALLSALERMGDTTEGRAVLKQFHFDRFVAGDEALYRGDRKDPADLSTTPFSCGP